MFKKITFLSVLNIIFGLTAFNVKPLQAQSLFNLQTTIISDSDNYSDLTNSDINNGLSNFIQVGSTDDPDDPNQLILEEISFINWDLTTIINTINDIKDNHPNIFLSNVDAMVTLTHTKTDPNNPNDSDPPPFGQNGRFLPELPRIDNINAYQVLNSQSWNENTAINTDPEQNRPQRGDLILFDGNRNIQVNSNENQNDFQNNYEGLGLNQVITEILNNNTDNDPSNDNPNLSITLEATEIFEFTSIGFYGVESFFSQNANNDSVKPALKVTYNIEQVPEPLTILGTGTALVFGASFKHKLAKANKK